MKAEIYMTQDAIPRGEYKKTELDYFKEAADLHIRCWLGARAEIYVNKPERVNIKEGRGVARCEGNSRVYYVTETALAKLEQKYTWACDF